MGLHDASLNGRVTEGTWRRVLLALHDCVCGCPACRAALFYDPEQAGQPLLELLRSTAGPRHAQAAGKPARLSEGAVLTSHHLTRDRDYRTACAVVEPDPRQPGRVVLRNRTDRIWTVVPDGEEPSGSPRTSGWACGRCVSISARPGGRSARARLPRSRKIHGMGQAGNGSS